MPSPALKKFADIVGKTSALRPPALLTAQPSAIKAVIVVNARFAGALASKLTGYATLLEVTVASGGVLPPDWSSQMLTE